MLKKQGFEILIASPSDYERLVAEIYFDGKFIALVSQERGIDIFDIETPGSNLIEKEVMRKFDLHGFQKIIEEARQRL